MGEKPRLLSVPAKILLALSRSRGLTYSEIVRAVGSSSSSVTSWLRALAGMGYIENYHGAYRLTVKGKELVEELRREVCGGAQQQQH